MAAPQGSYLAITVKFLRLNKVSIYAKKSREFCGVDKF